MEGITAKILFGMEIKGKTWAKRVKTCPNPITHKINVLVILFSLLKIFIKIFSFFPDFKARIFLFLPGSYRGSHVTYQ